MAEINWNILDPNAPMKAGMSVQAGADNALARRQAEQQSALQSMQMQQAQMAMQDKNALRNIYQQSGGDMNQTLAALKQSGNMEQAMALESKMQEQQKGKIAQAIEVEKLKRDLSMEVYANPSAQTAVAALTHLQQITGQDLSQDIAKVQASSPEQIQQWARGHIMTAEQMLPKLMQINQGGQTSVVPIDPMSGQQVGQGTAFQNTLTPGQTQANDLAERRLQVLEYGGGQKAPAGYRKTADGNLEAITGGPADPSNPINQKKTGELPGKVLPAAKIEDLADMKRVRDELASVGGLFSSTGVDTGPFAGRAQSVAAKFGLASDNFVNVKQKLAAVENIMLKLRSGAAVTEPEFARFQNEFPGVNDPPEIRGRKLQNAVKYATSLLDEKIALYDESGYKVPSSMKPPGPVDAIAKTSDYSEEDIAHTAKIHGITVEQVKKRLGVQ